MIGRLPQFPGVNAPHLATGVQPWVLDDTLADDLLNHNFKVGERETPE